MKAFHIKFSPCGLLCCLLCFVLLCSCTPKPKDFDTSADTVLAQPMLIFNWFKSYSLQYDTVSEPTAADGDLFYRVTDTRFPTLSAFESYVCGYFTDDIVQSLFAKGDYRDFDGALYVRRHDTELDPTISNVAYILSSETDKQIIYKAYVTYNSNADTVVQYDFIYDEIEDGVWRFSRFDYFWVRDIAQ